MTPRIGRAHTRRIVASAAAFMLALAPLGALADNMPPPGHADQGRNQPPRHSQGRPPAGHPEFNADQSGFARDYYRSHKWEGRPLPHGARVAVGHRLPKGAYKHPLPPEFAHRFPHRAGYQSYIVGDDIVLIAITTGIVVDILAHVH
jgi:Ni/Co efflux regulator RcnB